MKGMSAALKTDPREHPAPSARREHRDSANSEPGSGPEQTLSLP